MGVVYRSATRCYATGSLQPLDMPCPAVAPPTQCLRDDGKKQRVSEQRSVWGPHLVPAAPPLPFLSPPLFILIPAIDAPVRYAVIEPLIIIWVSLGPNRVRRRGGRAVHLVVVPRIIYYPAKV